jgi:hypothetical protein
MSSSLVLTHARRRVSWINIEMHDDGDKRAVATGINASSYFITDKLSPRLDVEIHMHCKTRDGWA